MTKIFLYLSILVSIASCEPAMYIDQKMELSVKKHKLVAILPPKVHMQLRPNQFRRTTADKLRKLEETTAYQTQEEIYGWLQRKQYWMNYSVTFQEAAVTKAKLDGAHIDYAALCKMTPEAIAQLLGVDAIVDMDINADKPQSEAVGFFFGGITNYVHLTTRVYDGETGNLLWSLVRNAKGGWTSSPHQLIWQLSKRSCRKLPYRLTEIDAAGHHKAKTVYRR